MLVLTIREGQSVKVGENIVIYFIEKRSGGIRLGFDASAGIPIRRLGESLPIPEVTEESKQ